LTPFQATHITRYMTLGHCVIGISKPHTASRRRTMDEGYYCVVCGKYIEAVDGVIVHDDIPHPYMAFDDEENTQ
jgi:hypothetical protein